MDIFWFFLKIRLDRKLEGLQQMVSDASFMLTNGAFAKIYILQLSAI